MICDACGDPLSIEEYDWNEIEVEGPDGDERVSLCDNCMGLIEDGDNPYDPASDDDDDDWPLDE